MIEPNAPVELSIVLPMYNEVRLAAASIGAALAGAAAACDEGLIGSAEVVVVDDGSVDGTGQILAKASTDDPRVRVVTHARNRGLGAAVRTGLAHSRGRLVLYTDADLPCDLRTSLPPALALLDDPDVGLVAGFRDGRGGEGLRRMAYSVGWNALVRVLLGAHVRDVNFAFKLLRREALAGMFLTSEGSFIDAELVAEVLRCGYQIRQLQVHYTARTEGRSTLSSAAVVRSMTKDLVVAARTARTAGHAPTTPTAAAAGLATTATAPTATAAGLATTATARPARPARATARLRLVVNADDFGLSTGVNDGILRGHRTGVVTTTSVLANAPAFRAGARLLRAEGTLGAGVHLALVGEDPPVLSPAEIPTLVRKGRFLTSWHTLVPALARGQVDPDDVRRELRAQIDAVKAEGIAIGHLNCHQHLQLWPTIGTIVIELAVEHGIEVVRVPRFGRAAGAPVDLLSARLRQRVEGAGLVAPWYVAGLAEAGRMTGAAIKRAVVEAAAAGRPVVEVACHPGEHADPERARYRWGYRWGDELDALCDPQLRVFIEQHGLELGGFCRRAAA